jgi:hypothetical protein
MAYKKYIKKEGKLYGPYIYQSKRIGDKVVSEYCGTDKLDYKKIAFVVLGFAVLLILIFSFFNFKGKVTGNVISDNQIISQTENVLVNNSGTTIYPTIYFTLILRQIESSLEPQETPTELPEENVEPIPEANETFQQEETPIEEEVSTEQNTPSETSSETPIEENSVPITGGVISSFFKTIYNFFLGFGITGKTIDSPLVKEIQGEVSVNNPFVYNLEAGESLELLSGSVKTNSKSLNDNSIKISLQENQFVVETDYSESVKSDKTNEVPIITETEYLTEEEKQILTTNFGDASVKIVKSELFNGRFIIEYELGKYKIEYSYDSNLDEATLKFQMEKERTEWLKDIAHKLMEKENVHVELNQSILTFPLQ